MYADVGVELLPGLTNASEGKVPPLNVFLIIGNQIHIFHLNEKRKQ